MSVQSALSIHNRVQLPKTTHGQRIWCLESGRIFVKVVTNGKNRITIVWIEGRFISELYLSQFWIWMLVSNYRRRAHTWVTRLRTIDSLPRLFQMKLFNEPLWALHFLQFVFLNTRTACIDYGVVLKARLVTESLYCPMVFSCSLPRITISVLLSYFETLSVIFLIIYSESRTIINDEDNRPFQHCNLCEMRDFSSRILHCHVDEQNLSGLSYQDIP